jgi:hypothetical protein
VKEPTLAEAIAIWCFTTLYEKAVTRRRIGTGFGVPALSKAMQRRFQMALLGRSLALALQRADSKRRRRIETARESHSPTSPLAVTMMQESKAQSQ